ncbi:hypothetical protein BV509_20550 [Rhodovulum sulfidophilum]|uniref:Uncharacterized protein n=1 Tax=Rhodovulum visakhapatnamense TaxID=364297 RepID=A0ABS1RL72_9RHOB|nr:hypothetical protein [Rhodovulum visakhapatnamense]MBL3571811.1 hypothetical protein [Rhodovulum visakhapatnamense]MBL3580432.1 hypothetical protein [Rhodovulum visakhapatnamense]OLS46507.1 hypothetical protein BV509_20550 [Rhodovulum sulfidophilum]
MKLLLTTATPLALLAAPALAAVNATEDLSAIRQPSADGADCFAAIAGTNAFQRTHAPGCIYYRAPTGTDPKEVEATDPDPADPGEAEGEDSENAGL